MGCKILLQNLLFFCNVTILQGVSSGKVINFCSSFGIFSGDELSRDRFDSFDCVACELF